MDSSTEMNSSLRMNLHWVMFIYTTKKSIQHKYCIWFTLKKLEQSPSKAYCLAHSTFSLNLLVSRSRKRKCCTHSALSERLICMTHFDSSLTDVNQNAHALSWANWQHIELILANICWGFKDYVSMLEYLITCLDSCGFYYEPHPKIKNGQHWTQQEI